MCESMEERVGWKNEWVDAICELVDGLLDK